MNLRARLAGALILASVGATAPAADWGMDAAASRLEFIATYERQAAPGVFRRFNTRLRFDPERPQGGRLHVTVMLANTDMDSTDINEAIRAPEWFDLARFQQAEFTSSDIRRTAPRQYVARGVLRLKGVNREVTVPFTWDGAGDTAVMAGELTLDRTAFGIGTGEWAAGDPIGLHVKVKFKVTLRKAG